MDGKAVLKIVTTLTFLLCILLQKNEKTIDEYLQFTTHMTKHLFAFDAESLTAPTKTLFNKRNTLFKVSSLSLLITGVDKNFRVPHFPLVYCFLSYFNCSNCTKNENLCGLCKNRERSRGHSARGSQNDFYLTTC